MNRILCALAFLFLLISPIKVYGIILHPAELTKSFNGIDGLARIPAGIVRQKQDRVGKESVRSPLPLSRKQLSALSIKELDRAKG